MKENLDKNPNGEEDDFYLQDIMKQFDELNNLF
jgi:ribosomal 30S subunit maturation factor RimM